MNASELGLNETQFWTLSFSEYVWMWNGYQRKVEREQMAAAREIVTMIHNTNVKKEHQKKSRRLWTLSIDPIIRVDENKQKDIFDSLPAHWRTSSRDN